MREVTAFLLIAIPLAACGDPSPPATPSIPIPYIEAGADRTAHVARALERADDPTSRALLLRIAPFLLPESDRVRKAITETVRRASPPDDLGVREAALTLRSLCNARLVHRSSIPTSVITGLADSLVDRRREDGTWGDPLSTSWAFEAIRTAAVFVPAFDERIGTAWREELRVGLRPWIDEDRPWDPIERLHLAVLVLPLDTKLAAPPLEVQWTVRRLIRDVPLDGDADLVLAWAWLWWQAGPATGPEHPAAAARQRFRERYEAGRLRAASADDFVKLVVALEWFGHDSFGAMMGYLPACRWAPPAR